MRSATGLLTAAAGALLALAACKGREAPREPGTPPPAPATVTVLATIPAGEPPPPAPPSRVLGLHQPTTGSLPPFAFAERGGGVAFAVERGEQVEVVHNGRSGKRYRAIGSILLSPDGRRHAHGALEGQQWRMVADGQEGPAFSAVRQPTFSPDGAHLAYQGMAGERWHLVVDGAVNRGTPTRYLQHEFGAGERLVYLEDAGAGAGRLVVSDLAFKAAVTVAEDVSSFALDPGRHHAVAIAGPAGRRRVLTVGLDQARTLATGRLYDAIEGLVPGRDGGPPAYLAEREGRHLVVLGEAEGTLAAGEFVVAGLVLRPDGAAVGAVVASSATGQVTVRQLTAGGWEGASTYEEAEGLVYDGPGRSLAYAARRGGRWFVVVDGKEGPPLDRVVSPLFTPDGRIVYRARQDGRRFVVLASRDGTTVRRYPPHEQVFPVQVTQDGKGLAHGAKDGPLLTWTVEAM